MNKLHTLSALAAATLVAGCNDTEIGTADLTITVCDQTRGDVEECVAPSQSDCEEITMTADRPLETYQVVDTISESAGGQMTTTENSAGDDDSASEGAGECTISFAGLKDGEYDVHATSTPAGKEIVSGWGEDLTLVAGEHTELTVDLVEDNSGITVVEPETASVCLTATHDGGDLACDEYRVNGEATTGTTDPEGECPSDSFYASGLEANNWYTLEARGCSPDAENTTYSGIDSFDLPKGETNIFLEVYKD